MNRYTPIAGIVELVLLCLLCPWCRAPAIENDVRQAALTCAAEGRWDGLELHLALIAGHDS